MNPWRADLDRNGFAIVPDLLEHSEVTALLEAIVAPDEQPGVRKRSTVYAIRNLLDMVPAVSALASGNKLMNFAGEVLGDAAKPVKATLFDKTPDANWLVPWHQDLTICVNERREIDGFGPWTAKAGVVNVQPPVSVLEKMLAIRIHLDDCDGQNGALRVLPGTHSRGRLNSEEIDAARNAIEAVTCTVPSGGAILMRPLLLHASSPATSPRHRRVIHIDYAGVDLPSGLSWFAGSRKRLERKADDTCPIHV